MQKIYLAVFLTLLIFAFGCKKKKQQAAEVRTEKPSQALPESVKLDSSAIANFIAANQPFTPFEQELNDFYRSRDYEYAWIDKSGINSQGVNLHKMMSPFSNARLDSLISILNDKRAVKQQAGLLPEAELLLTASFFDYAQKEYEGQNVSPYKYSWNIPRKKIDLGKMLAGMVKVKDINNYPMPVHPQYDRLKHYLLEYEELQKKEKLKPIVLTENKLELGAVSPSIPLIKHRLFLLGDSPARDTSSTFDNSMLDAVRRFQERHGLEADGVIGKGFMSAINTPISDRIQQILVNLERLRWLPVPERNYLMVNIPEYKLHVYENGKHAWSTPVVVGKKKDQTVVFTESMKYVVFAPYWNVPESIVEQEIMADINRNPNYLAENNMEWVGNNLRQLPGDDNALGKVKFLFPNRYNIYLHDTPAKALFNESRRAYSHGCIRVKNPEKLAQLLLDWPADSIRSNMDRTEEKVIKLKRNPQVYIVYLTAFVDVEGKLHFREDIYGHDTKMEQLIRKRS